MQPPLSIIFLDFDGVLHPLDCEGARAEHFCYLRNLEAVLRDYPHAQLVVCSEWRKGTDWPAILALFSADIRVRVIGATPVLPIERPDEARGLRQREALAFLGERGLSTARWIAMDDMPDNWEPDEPRLIVCDDGFCEREERLLRRALGSADAAD